MKRITLVLLLVLMLVGISYAGIIGDKIKFSGDVTVLSDYVWRGQLLDDDPSIQTGIYAQGYNLSIGLWTSYPLSDGDSLNSEEVNYTIEYGKECGAFSLAAGYIYYDFPDLFTSHAQEIYAKVGVNLLFSPSVTCYYDFSDSDNTRNYTSFDCSYGINNLAINGHFGVYSHERGEELGIGVEYPAQLPNSILTPFIRYSVPFGALDDSFDPQFYAGLKIGFEL